MSQIVSTFPLVGKIADALMDGLFPCDERCGLCKRSVWLQKPYLCAPCLEKLVPVHSPCGKCGRPLFNPLLACPYCNPHAEPYTRRFLGYVLNGEAKYLMHRYKYGGERFLATVLSALFTERLKAQLGDGDLPFTVVTSIPSGKKRRALRGFDHCGDLARAVAKDLGILYRPYLERVTHERAQAESNRAERAYNLEQAFCVLSNDMTLTKNPGQQRLLIVDDVLTTGATIEAATMTLKRTYPHLEIYEGAVFYTPETVGVDCGEKNEENLFEQVEF